MVKDSLFLATDLFKINWESKKKINVNQGGTSSGKTYAIMQCIFHHARQEAGVSCLVTSEDIPALKKGAYKDAEKIFKGSPTLQREVKFWNKTERKIIFHNGSEILFTSSSSVLDAQQGKRDYLFVNEANSIEYAMYWQLEKRTYRKTYLDYNPSAPFWVHEKLLKPERTGEAGNVAFFRSWHVHNPFIPEALHYDLENEDDPDLFLVYSRGLTGNLKGLIYPNWMPIDDDVFNDMLEVQHDEMFGGCDFGFTNDPTAGVQMFRIGANLYVREMFYKSGLPPEMILNHIRTHGFEEGYHPLYCDHVPDMVDDLCRLGINAMNARKGNGAINAGILRLKKMNVFICRSSTNIWYERERYIWDTDKVTGLPINKPVDKNNHLMDAIRYGFYTQFFHSM